jgi:hypothetical protein
MDFLGYSLLALGVSKLIILLGLQVFGDYHEAQTNKRLKSLNTKRAYRPKVQAVLFAEKLRGSVQAQLDQLVELDYPLQAIIVVASSKSTSYRQAKRYAKKYKHMPIHVVPRPEMAVSHLKATLTLLLDGSATILPNCFPDALLAFRDKKVQAVTPATKFAFGNSLFLACIAVNNLITINFRRGLRITQKDIYGGMFIRTKLLKPGVTITPPSQTIRVRTPVFLVQLPAFDRAWLSSLHLLIDAGALIAAVMLFGSVQGLGIALFAVVFMLFLATLAIWNTPKLRIIDRLNLTLLVPFAYAIKLVSLPFRLVFTKQI